MRKSRSSVISCDGDTTVNDDATVATSVDGEIDRDGRAPPKSVSQVSMAGDRIFQVYKLSKMQASQTFTGFNFS